MMFPPQIQEGCRRLLESKHGAIWDCRGDEGDHEEYGQKTSEPPEKPSDEESDQEGGGDARERPQLAGRILLALLQLLVLLLLRVLWRGGQLGSAQPQRQRVARLLRDEHHPSHRGRARRILSGGLWCGGDVRSRPGLDRGREGPRHGRGVIVPLWTEMKSTPGFIKFGCEAISGDITGRDWCVWCDVEMVLLTAGFSGTQFHRSSSYWLSCLTTLCDVLCVQQDDTVFMNEWTALLSFFCDVFTQQAPFSGTFYLMWNRGFQMVLFFVAFECCIILLI